MSVPTFYPFLSGQQILRVYCWVNCAYFSHLIYIFKYARAVIENVLEMSTQTAT